MYEHMPCDIYRQLRFCYRSFKIVQIKNMSVTPVFIDDVCVLVFVFVGFINAVWKIWNRQPKRCFFQPQIMIS
jgi:hypothetical protein